MHENSIINHDHHGQHTNSQACLAYAIKTPPSAADWLATETFALAKPAGPATYINNSLKFHGNVPWEADIVTLRIALL
ncbi:unnamed protein product [Prunus armeniaca]|uniref:Uncharacterized protein n=1 Tax=Prunus armeniaca TaxID=36596 RepID=A0A6J5TYA5_PRUAR|nr:unnamed protein product [Prunus armeniaca]